MYDKYIVQSNVRLFDQDMSLNVDKVLIEDIINTSNKAAQPGLESNISM